MANKTTLEDSALTSEQQGWVDAAWDAIDLDELRELVSDMVAIPSPTGEEAQLARYLVDRLRTAGLRSKYQPIDESQGNAIGVIDGNGLGSDLLLYAPIDTLTTGRELDDVPNVGPLLRPDMVAQVSGTDEWVIGLGASNPKGHGACIIAAAAAVRRAGIPLTGDVIVGLGAGGMPVNRRPTFNSSRRNVGQGVGCSFMLEQGIYPDFAIIVKPGWSVAWEEVGLCWFEVSVRGTFNYVGSRHRLEYCNPIVESATVVAELESWFHQYSQEHTSGLVSPQGQIGSIRGGWDETASLSPAVCTLRVDLRIGPRTSPADAKHEFFATMDRIREAHAHLELGCEMVLSIPGTTTARDNFIVEACIRGWETVEGKTHSPVRGTSGATDANILRSRGIPTARVGMPKAIDDQGIEVDFAMGMNACDVRHMKKLTQVLIHSIISTCTVTRVPLQRISTSDAG